MMQTMDTKIDKVDGWGGGLRGGYYGPGCETGHGKTTIAQYCWTHGL